MNIEKLDQPPAVSTANRAMEMARIWIVDGHQEIALSRNIWKDPAAWGVLLADVARHVSKIYEDSGSDRNQAFSRIIAGLKAELDNSEEE